MPTKICSNCKVEKPKTEFHTRKKSRDGYNGVCKCCVSEARKNNSFDPVTYRREYRKKNAAEIALKKKLNYSENRDSLRAWHKKYYSENRDAILAQKEKYRLENRDAVLSSKKKHYKNNSTRLVAVSAESVRRRRKLDPLFNLGCNIRRLIGLAIGGKGFTKKSKTQDILGCSFEVFKAHIESQFTEGMSWSRRGEWHLDHIWPVSSATTEEELIKLNHYTNFQPLWAEDNMKKGAKLPDIC